jgi:hypothetical protein
VCGVTDKQNYIIELLGKKHNRAAFCCGIEPLDRYFKTQITQDARKRVAAPFVLVETQSGVVAGYYTLSATRAKKYITIPDWIC